MKNIQLIILSTVFLCAISTTNAQDYSDFSRLFSQSNQGGSARIQGIGGAQVSLGGDVSSAFSNPAGLGFFNRSQFAFSPQVASTNSTSEYLGSEDQDLKLNANLANMGFILNRSNKKGKWKGGSFGFNVTRINDFNSNVSYSGNSESDDFAAFAIFDLNFGNQSTLALLALDPDEEIDNSFVADGFYNVVETDQTDVIIDGSSYSLQEFYPNKEVGDTIFFFDRNFYDINDPNIVAFPTSSQPTKQSETIRTSGAHYQTNISYGGNYDDKVYFGASIGFSSIHYKVSRTYIERPTDSDLTSIVLQDERDISGNGINATVGLIVRPIDIVSIGLSYTTPTQYLLNDFGSLNLDANFTDGTVQSGVEFNPFQFDLRTPAKINVGASIFIAKNGFISGDLEFVDYRGGNISAPRDSFTEENADIRESSTRTTNVRLGGEYRIQIFRLRAGYSYMGDALKNDGNGRDRSIRSFSFGGGVKLKKYFGDLALVSTNKTTFISPYPDSPIAEIESERISTTLTVGMSF